MTTKVMSATLQGVDSVPIEVEVELLRRLPGVTIVGRPDYAVRETAERVRSAIEASGFEFPRQRIVVNLAPTDLRKDGTPLDLPIALAILAASEQIPVDYLDKFVAVGELSLSGVLRPIRGVDALASGCGSRFLMCPRDSIVTGDVQYLPVDTLQDAVDFCRVGSQESLVGGYVQIHEGQDEDERYVDLADLRVTEGNRKAIRALTIAAVSGLPLLLIGQPGCGKSMLARRLSTILPSLSEEEALETAKIHSVAGLQTSHKVHRPFRAPHHTITSAGMVGDRTLRPGEVSLAHHGVLFLDEAPEFARTVLELLREPLEDGRVQITRAAGIVRYPAKIQLVLASNPCPCGRAPVSRGGRGHELCRCTPAEQRRYLERIPSRMVGMAVTMEPSLPSEVSEPAPRSAVVRAEVAKAKAILAKLDMNQFTPLARIGHAIAALDGHLVCSDFHMEEAKTYLYESILSGMGLDNRDPDDDYNLWVRIGL